MEKQIEEMAADIRLNMQIQPNPKEHPSHQLARLLVEDGYRKASDVAEEIFAEIAKILRHHGTLAERDKSEYGEIIIMDIGFAIAELKKKYTKTEGEE